MDLQHPACSLLIQPLISRLATLSKVPQAGWGPVEGRSDLVLSISLRYIPVCPDTHDSSIVLRTVSFVRD
jgi:hypothetical protein